MKETERLTHERVNGIKRGYWSAAKKDELVERLAAYEDTGLFPDKIKVLINRDTPAKISERNWEGICPSCGRFLFSSEQFCCRCGQRLEWWFENGGKQNETD